MIDPKRKTIGPAADMWMFGCIAYILTFGVHPFDGFDDEAILKCELQFPRNKDYLSDLTKRLLSKDPNERPKAKDLVENLCKILLLIFKLNFF